jgi:hypothetical protein
LKIEAHEKLERRLPLTFVIDGELWFDKGVDDRTGHLKTFPNPRAKGIRTLSFSKSNTQSGADLT